MTKPKAGAAAPLEEQPVAEFSTPAIEESSHERPREGGSYIRNADGSLTREEEA